LEAEVAETFAADFVAGKGVLFDEGDGPSGAGEEDGGGATGGAGTDDG
jgi:hypothetical protein